MLRNELCLPEPIVRIAKCTDCYTNQWRQNTVIFDMLVLVFVVVSCDFFSSGFYGLVWYPIPAPQSRLPPPGLPAAAAAAAAAQLHYDIVWGVNLNVLSLSFHFEMVVAFERRWSIAINFRYK